MNNIIHETSIVSSKAKLGNNLVVGPFCIIGDDVVIGDNVTIKSHVVIEGNTLIGNNNIIYPFASLGQPPQDLKYKGEKSRVIIGIITQLENMLLYNLVQKREEWKQKLVIIAY